MSAEYPPDCPRCRVATKPAGCVGVDPAGGRDRLSAALALSCPYCRTPSSASVWSLSSACPCGAAEWDVVVGEGVAVPWVAWWMPGSTPEWWWE